MMNQIGKFSAITRTSARIGIEYNITSRCDQLFFDIKTVTVIRKRAAMYFNYEGIFF